MLWFVICDSMILILTVVTNSSQAIVQPDDGRYGRNMQLLLATFHHVAT